MQTLTNPWPSPAVIPSSDGYFDWFTAPQGVVLAAGASYHVAVQTPGGSTSNLVTIEATLSDQETGDAGWTIENARRQDGVLSSTGSSIVIAIRARPRGVNFSEAHYTATEGGAAAQVTVRLQPARAAAVTIPLRLVSRDGGATAADHSAIPASVTIAAGDTEASFTVTATDDAVDEDDGESVTIAFGDLPDGLPAGRFSSATVALADDDEGVYFDALAYTATEAGPAPR